MGAYLSEPLTVKESEDGNGNNLCFGASSMQGWRATQEDAHNCVANFDLDKKMSYFGVYDGHGGSEVAIYLSRYFPDLLKNIESYKNGDINQALIEAFLKMDASIKDPDVLAEIQKIAKSENGETEGESVADYEEENVGELYKEATMPLEKLVAKYQGSVCDSSSSEQGSVGEKPCSSKNLASSSGSCTNKTNDGKIVSPSSLKTETGCQNVSTTAVSKSQDKPSDECAGGSGSSSRSSNKNSKSHDLEAVCDSTSSGIDKKCSENLISESSEAVPSSTVIPEVKKEECSSSVKTPTNGEVSGSSSNHSKQICNGNEAEAATSSSSTTVDGDKPLKEEIIKPRKGKVHPVPVIVTQSSPSKVTRVSPRKRRHQEMAFADSDSDLDSSDSDHVAKLGDGSDSDDSEDSSDSDDLGEEEEEANSDDDDDEDEEDDNFLNEIQEPGFDSGCTAVVGLFQWNAQKLNLWVANAGDSRCVVSRDGVALEMSHDHKPESETEALRIVKAGGKVTEDGRVNGGLNLSRAIGDHSYKQNTSLPPEEQMISPLPTIQHVELDPKADDFVILACDGVWNCMSSQQVVDFVAKRIKSTPLSKICEELFDACLAGDTYGDGTGCDNFTAIIVKFKNGSGVKRTLDECNTEEEDHKKPKLEV